MTSANRRSLEAVPNQDFADSRSARAELDSPACGGDSRAQAVMEQWAPEHQLIGALMHLPARQAKPILDAVPGSAIWRPITRWAYELIRALVDAGRDPDPVFVLRRASTQSPSDALYPKQPLTPCRQHELAVYLADTYTRVLEPHSAASYAREVLDDAYRRAVREHGKRLAHLAEVGAEAPIICDEVGKLARLTGHWTGVSHTDIP
jgi:replicative DNA helicase